MTARDTTEVARSFLSSEEAFQFVKDLHTRNLIVPVVGDFGSSGAMRRIAEYVRAHGGRVEAVYASNVAVYLTRAQIETYCASLAALPANPRAAYMEASRMRTLSTHLRSCPQSASRYSLARSRSRSNASESEIIR